MRGIVAGPSAKLQVYVEIPWPQCFFAATSYRHEQHAGIKNLGYYHVADGHSPSGVWDQSNNMLTPLRHTPLCPDRAFLRCRMIDTLLRRSSFYYLLSLFTLADSIAVSDICQASFIKTHSVQCSQCDYLRQLYSCWFPFLAAH